MKARFNSRYISGDLPWNINRPDFNLVSTVREFDIAPGKALDIGCGTGDNVFWLTQAGFNATGIDIADKAIELALNKSEKNSLHADFFTRDILSDTIPGSPFQFAFDRGCFHTFSKKRARRSFVRRVHGLLEEGGYWLTLAGNTDDGRLKIGPPKLTAGELVSAVEPFFEIIALKQGRFDSNDPVPSKIWVCLMLKR